MELWHLLLSWRMSPTGHLLRKYVCLIFFIVQSLFTYFALKYYKLNDEVAIKCSREREIIGNIVVSSVAMKSVMS